jgi:hypothetical protein
MPKSRSQNRARAPRVKLAGTVLSLVRLENGRQITAKLHQLSVSGGLLHLPQALDESIKVEVIFHIGSGTVRNKAVLLFPMWATQGCLQPFEFLDLTAENQQILERHVSSLLERGEAAVPEDAPEQNAKAAGSGS